jgi:GNAT superfamily N-acetyltransferase
MVLTAYRIRVADAADADAIAEAHRDSIRTIGWRFYRAGSVDDWLEGIAADLYLKAMTGGEVFFIATAPAQGEGAGKDVVLGFASDYPIGGSRHGTSVYVRGSAARQGLGSALYRRAEAHAVEHGASSIEIEASLAGVEFYKANGFAEVGRGQTRLMSGRPIACVFMRKTLA